MKKAPALETPATIAGSPNLNSLPKQSKPVLRIPMPIDKAVGLGDFTKSMTAKIGFAPCGGCQKRAAVLNSWVGFTPISGE